jgi:hypothetical protein
VVDRPGDEALAEASITLAPRTTGCVASKQQYSPQKKPRLERKVYVLAEIAAAAAAVSRRNKSMDATPFSRSTAKVLPRRPLREHFATGLLAAVLRVLRRQVDPPTHCRHQASGGDLRTQSTGGEAG